jgi:hypothetical protein
MAFLLTDGVIMKKSITVIAALALVLSASTGAFAAKGLLTGKDIKNGSLTGADIKRQSLGPALFSDSAKDSLSGHEGPTGARGAAGPAGLTGLAGLPGVAGGAGTNGASGPAGSDGSDGTDGTDGIAGTNGTNGLAGVNGINGLAGSDGADGTNGLAGTNGSNGANGVNGTITPLWATAGLTALPTASPPTTVVFLDNVPAGRYVVLAKTQLSHTGAGDSIDCALKAGNTTVDQIAMKTLPALAAVPASLQAVITVPSTTQLSVECDVFTANGAANFSSLIAMPTS